MPTALPGFPCSSGGKESACNAGDLVQSLGWEYPWRRKWQPTLVSLLGKSYGQRSLVSCSPWGRKQSGTTERLTLTYLLTALPTSQPKLCLTIKLKEVNSKGKIGCLWRCRPREGFTEEMTLKLSMYKLREKTAHVEKIYLIWLHH